MLAAASTLVVLVIGGILLFRHRNTAKVIPTTAMAPTLTGNEIFTGNGSRTHVTLPDGTIVWLNAGSRIVHFGQKRCKLLVVDQPVGDADALVEPDQMRAGEDVDAVTGRLQRRAEEGAGRALAVGSGDMENRRQMVLGTPEPIQQREDAFEPELIAGGRQLGQAVELRLDVGVRRAGEVH